MRFSNISITHAFHLNNHHVGVKWCNRKLAERPDARLRNSRRGKLSSLRESDAPAIQATYKGREDS